MRNEIQVAGQQTGIKLRPYEHHANITKRIRWASFITAIM